VNFKESLNHLFQLFLLFSYNKELDEERERQRDRVKDIQKERQRGGMTYRQKKMEGDMKVK
jgi:hypothetical protein